MKQPSQAIVIIHNRANSVWLNECLNSIQTDYPILISNHEGWVMEGIKKIWQTTKYDELVFLNESMIVKDNAIWDILFNQYRNKSVMLGERYLMFFGKFRRVMVNKLSFPDVRSKYEDVMLGEGGWCRQYMELKDHIALQPLADGDRFEMKHGRKNMVLENDYFIKYKATWDMETLLKNG